MFDSAIQTALSWTNEGRKVALATVVETWGSAPRPIGAMLVIDEHGEFEGSVSGGCVEGAVILAGQETIKTGQGTLLEFGVADEDAFAVGLACGGTIKIVVQAVGTHVSAEQLQRRLEAMVQRKSCVVETNLVSFHTEISMTDAQDDLKLAETAGEFVYVQNPAYQLIVVGAVHIAQHLADLATMVGYHVIIIDPRSGFANENRFPRGTLMVDWPDDALAQCELDAQTALVTLAHDPKLDDPALVYGLQSKAFYVGALGSRRTHAKRLERLSGANADLDLGKIHAPVGLNIGAKSPAEIAISIMAEITLKRRGPK